MIRHNIRLHDRLGIEYETIHGEIFNDVEQSRLRRELERATALVRRDRDLAALDFGCGTGNVTSHLLDMGLKTVAADVSRRLVTIVAERHRPNPLLHTALLNGRDLMSFADDTFDLVTAYSVLHHIPDYLAAVNEMARVVRPGGVIFIDHEIPPGFWSFPAIYAEYRSAWEKPRRRKHWFRPSSYYLRLRRLLNPRLSSEGDIHVSPDDHIDWDAIKSTLEQASFRIVEEKDYLVYRKGCPREVYDRYAPLCDDSRQLLARKGAKRDLELVRPASTFS